jgi:dihydrofolate reductase
MRKVIFLVHVSLDGFTAGPNGEMEWITSADDAWENVLALQDRADTALFGRVNFEGFEAYWASEAAQQSTSKGEKEHAQWLSSADKIVFSKTLEKVDWSGTRIIKDNLAREINKLKQQPGKDMILFGGAEIASAFMREGLIDEYIVNVNPIILGQGKNLFQDLRDKINLKLVNSKVSKSGVAMLHYAAE